MQEEQYDVVIIGSGVGGGAVALQLAGSGARVLILERGPVLPREPQNWDAESVFADLRYRSKEIWTSGDRSFRPGQYYFVGGHTKFYGTAMFRFRERDFDAVEHEDGMSPAWPIKYADLAPYYDDAERLFGVRGSAGLDPTEPPRRGPYPHPAIPHEPVIAEVADRLKGLGLHPFPMPAAVDFGAGGTCQRCGTCDAFPCRVDAKGDAEMCLVRPALLQPNVQLRSEVMVERLITDDSGRRIVAAEVTERGVRRRIQGKVFVLSAGAINSAALLQRSATPRHPSGLANSSDVVGRYFMNHNCTGLMALHPFKHNDTKFPKTLSINDYYFGDADNGGKGPPLGNLQLLGKLREPMLRAAMPRWMPRAVGRAMTARSVDWYVMSEDLPNRESTVRLNKDGSIDLRWHRTNMNAHRRWVRKASAILRKTGYPLILTRPFDMATPSHQCGTVRFGDDPATSALDTLCKAWDHDNLYVVDAGFFPSSAAVNPALTIAAQALRVGRHLRREVLR